VENVCKWCGETYHVKQSRATESNYCSGECKYKALSDNLRDQVSLECDHCGEEFSKKPSQVWERNFCSKECWYQSQTVTHREFNCHYCGRRFERQVGDFDPGAGRIFCSQECVSDWKSDEWTDGDHPAYSFGQDHPLWNGGRRLTQTLARTIGEGSWQRTAEQVREASGRQCEFCGREESSLDTKMHVHHIVPLKYGGGNGEYNLMALCPQCHTKVEWFTQRALGDPILPDSVR